MLNSDGKSYAAYCYSVLTSLGMNSDMAKIAVAQFAHETAGFTSHVFTTDNNVCGMKFADQSLASDSDSSGYAVYDNIENSIRDFYKWFTRHMQGYDITSIADYVYYLKHNFYFEADETLYLNAVTKFYNQLYA